MLSPKDPVEVVASIKGSIEVSPRKSRRVRFHNIRSLFGCQAWTAQRKELVTRLLDEQGILPQPRLADAGANDWILLSMPVLAESDPKGPDPRPGDDWFEHLMSVSLDSEREVEMHFASPLFHQLGYEDAHEAAGFGFVMYEGVSHKRVEADLVYFTDNNHSLKQGTPLVLVEAKSASHKLDAATEQAKSYANWVKPAYYVVTNGDLLIVWNYQGAVPDVKMTEFKRAELRNTSTTSTGCSTGTVIKARAEKLARLISK
jgi:hypothetical protein